MGPPPIRRCHNNTTYTEAPCILHKSRRRSGIQMPHRHTPYTEVPLASCTSALHCHRSSPPPDCCHCSPLMTVTMVHQTSASLATTLMSTTLSTVLKTEISFDTAAAAAGRHGDEIEDDDVVLLAADCTLPTTLSYTHIHSTHVPLHFWLSGKT